MDPALTFRFHSNQNASKIISRHFTGHTTSETLLNYSDGPIIIPAFDTDGDHSGLSAAEQQALQRNWWRVSASIAPFDVKGATQEPLTNWLINVDGFACTCIREVLTN